MTTRCSGIEATRTAHLYLWSHVLQPSMSIRRGSMPLRDASVGSMQLRDSSVGSMQSRDASVSGACRLQLRDLSGQHTVESFVRSSADHAGSVLLICRYSQFGFLRPGCWPAFCVRG